MTENAPVPTPYDTGERLEPMPWHVQPLNLFGLAERDGYGRVDFDDDEGCTHLTVHVSRNADKAGHTLHISSADRSLTVTNDEEEGPLIESPSPTLQDLVDKAIDSLRTAIEREEAEVYWNAGSALILVPGEKGVRRQQLISVSTGREPMSAYVKNWHGGVRNPEIG